MIRPSCFWHKAFTLIELMIVVSIVGILASIAIPKFANLVRRAQEGRTKGNLGNIRSAISIYYSDMEGQFPQDPSSLTISGKYLGSIPSMLVPNYHVESTNIGLIGLGPIGFDAIHTSVATSEPFGAGWSYGFTVTIMPTTDMSNFGVFWIACSHTDTKGTAWTAY
jgi:general secretion pathway protein G